MYLVERRVAVGFLSCASGSVGSLGCLGLLEASVAGSAEDEEIVGCMRSSSSDWDAVMGCEVGGGAAGLAGSGLSDRFCSSLLVFGGLVGAFAVGAVLVGAGAVGVGSLVRSAGWAASSVCVSFVDEAGAGGADTGAHGGGGGRVRFLGSEEEWL